MQVYWAGEPCRFSRKIRMKPNLALLFCFLILTKLNLSMLSPRGDQE